MATCSPDQAIRLNPGGAKGYWRRGMALQGRKMFGKALLDLQQAQTLAPDDAGIARALEQVRKELQGSGEEVQAEEKRSEGAGGGVGGSGGGTGNSTRAQGHRHKEKREKEKIVGRSKSGFSRMFIEEVSSSEEEGEEEKSAKEVAEAAQAEKEGMRRVMIQEDSESEDEEEEASQDADEGKDSLDTEQAKAALDSATLGVVVEAKQAGNAFFKAKDYSKATLSYSKAIDAFGTLSEVFALLPLSPSPPS